MNWITKPPLLLRLFYPSVLWRCKTSKKEVFLTFDDGPVPGVTPWVLDILTNYGACGTFFCVGDNIRKYPGVFSQLVNSGNEAATHGFSHKPGNRLGIESYLKDIDLGLQYNAKARWFRPPHGFIYPWWVSHIRAKGVGIAMWDVLSGDYDRNLSPDKVIQNVIKHIRPGSLIVFHDSLKAWPNLKIALPAVLDWMSKNGYTTNFLSSINQNKRIL
ncbi:polysaccharide deacetylase family protein [Marinilabilia rubra]|uniref:Polysaccharide deacetylase n=1 Tax=Marinilabilia rubra TaxID=2162893 RepID=A0A2U2BBH0_9BACT|nr:polysaccharide deacetylase family protein [Marinilabilia rubra]PWE00422.1 polysaccharide deacetylase [Marinilabilia rubra]